MVMVREIFSAFQPEKRWQKIINFPIVRILISIAFLIPVVLIHNLVIAFAKDSFEPTAYEWFIDVWWIIDVSLFMLAYYLYARLIEKRPAREISTSGAISEAGSGIFIGAILVSLTVGIMYFAESYAIDDFGEWNSFIHLFRQFGVDSFLEELIFRVILFRLLEEWLGSLWGFIISCLIFSLAHSGNPNSTVLTTISITALGIVLTACFMLTRRLWLVWGTHFAWNYFQTAVFGMSNSGRSDHVTFVTPLITGPEWLTGGAFGIEASWLAFSFLTITALVIVRVAIRRGQVVKPIWLRAGD